MPVDIAECIRNFLLELGLFDLEDQKISTNDTEEQYELDESLSSEDLAILFSIYPSEVLRRRNLPLLDLPSYGSSQHKKLLLDTIARLSLNPLFTPRLFHHFQKIHLDLASRWLYLLGFDGLGYASSAQHSERSLLVAVLTAFARQLGEFPALYPCVKPVYFDGALISCQTLPHLHTTSVFPA